MKKSSAILSSLFVEGRMTAGITHLSPSAIIVPGIRAKSGEVDEGRDQAMASVHAGPTTGDDGIGSLDPVSKLLWSQALRSMH